MTNIGIDTIVEAGDEAINCVIDLLIERGHCDQKAIERACRVTAETGQRLDSVLIRLGIVAERALAEAYAASLGVGLVAADEYPVGEPLFPERLAAKFLRNVRALPLRIERGALVLAVADPLDRFISASISAATGLPVSIEIATPIELEAAFDRLYPEGGTEAAREDAEAEAAEPLEEDAERLKDLASEAPVIRLVNQIIARAVETQASDIHIEPFEDRLRVRYRYDGVLHEAECPPARLTAAIISRIKIMAQAGHRRAPAAAGRAHQAARCAARRSISASPPCRRCTARRWCCACSTAAPSRSTTRKLGLPPASVDRLQRGAGAAERHRAGHRPDRQRQDHHAVHRPARR